MKKIQILTECNERKYYHILSVFFLVKNGKKNEKQEKGAKDFLTGPVLA